MFASAVPKMADTGGGQASGEEQPQTCSMPTCLESSEDSEEAEVVVETLLLMELADLGSLDKYMVHAHLKHNRVSKSASAMLQQCGLHHAAEARLHYDVEDREHSCEEPALEDIIC